jgi:hypothetical protein
MCLRPNFAIVSQVAKSGASAPVSFLIDASVHGFKAALSMDKRRLIVGPGCIVDLEGQRVMGSFHLGTDYSSFYSIATSPFNPNVFLSFANSELRVFDARAADAAGVVTPSHSVVVSPRSGILSSSIHLKDDNTVRLL